MKKINMKTKGSNKTFDEGFEQFVLEHFTTEEALEDYLDTMSELEPNEENKRSIEQTKKSLELLEIAISERCNEIISAEKKS